MATYMKVPIIHVSQYINSLNKNLLIGADNTSSESQRLSDKAPITRQEKSSETLVRIVYEVPQTS